MYLAQCNFYATHIFTSASDFSLALHWAYVRGHCDAITDTMWQSVNTVFAIFFFFLLSYSLQNYLTVLAPKESTTTTTIEHIRSLFQWLFQRSMCIDVIAFVAFIVDVRHRHCCYLVLQFNGNLIRWWSLSLILLDDSFFLLIFVFFSHFEIQCADSKRNYWERIRFRHRHITLVIDVIKIYMHKFETQAHLTKWWAIFIDFPFCRIAIEIERHLTFVYFTHTHILLENKSSAVELESA